MNEGWSELRAGGLRLRVGAGKPIFVDGDPPRTLVLVAAGVLKVVAARRDGQPVTVGLRGAGGVHLGPVARSDAASSHLIPAVASDVVVITAARLHELVRRTPALILPVLSVAEQQLRDTERRAAELARLPAPDRVRHTLARLASQFKDQNDTSVVLPISQFDLADLAGVSRLVAARTLRGLRDNGHIRTARFRIDLIRPDRIDENTI